MTRDEVSDNQLGKVITLCLKQIRRSLGKKRGRSEVVAILTIIKASGLTYGFTL